MDWLWSKSVVAVGVAIMLSSVSAYFASEREQALRGELDTVSLGLACFIDNVLDLSAKTAFSVGYEDDAHLLLPKHIDGSPYSVELRLDSVILASKGRSAIAHWSGILHLWRWDGSPLDWDLVHDLDQRNPRLLLSSGQLFEIVLEEIGLRNIETTLAFALPRL